MISQKRNWLILMNFFLSEFQEPLNLTKEGFWSTLKRETPQINRTQECIIRFKIKNGQELTMF